MEAESENYDAFALPCATDLWIGQGSLKLSHKEEMKFTVEAG